MSQMVLWSGVAEPLRCWLDPTARSTLVGDGDHACPVPLTALESVMTCGNTLCRTVLDRPVHVLLRRPL